MKSTLSRVLICILFFSGQLPGQSQRSASVNPISYGYVSGAEISDFGSANLDKPCQALIKRRFADATGSFQLILKQKNKQSDADNLPAYIGLLQAKPQMWSVEAKRLQPAVQNNNSISQFKLGTVLYYEWGQQSSAQDTTKVAKAQFLINSAWKKNKLPIIGMMLKEVSVFGTSYGTAHSGLGLCISEQLIKQLAGPKAYQAYLRSKAGDPTVQPFLSQSTPSISLRPLRGIIRDLAYQSQIQGGTSILKGNNVIFTPAPLSDDQKRAYRFMTVWDNEITKAIQSQRRQNA